MPDVVFGRAAFLRQALDDGGCDLDRVLHLALGIAGMGADAVDGDGGAVGGEGLVLDAAGALAIHGVAEIRAELLKIDIVDAAAEISSSGVNRILMVPCFSSGLLMKKCAASMISATPALLSAPEQRGAVGGDDVVADLVLQRGVLGEANDLAGIARQGDVAAAIVLHTICGLTFLPVQSGEVSMCEQKQITGTFLSCVGRDRSIDVAVSRRDERPRRPWPSARRRARGRGLSAFRSRARPGFRIGLGVDGDVAQEALGHGMRKR